MRFEVALNDGTTAWAEIRDEDIGDFLRWRPDRPEATEWDVVEVTQSIDLKNENGVGVGALKLGRMVNDEHAAPVEIVIKAAQAADTVRPSIICCHAGDVQAAHEILRRSFDREDAKGNGHD